MFVYQLLFNTLLPLKPKRTCVNHSCSNNLNINNSNHILVRGNNKVYNTRFVKLDEKLATIALYFYYQLDTLG